MRRVEPPLILKDVSERNLHDVAKALGGYLKFASMAWIRALREPILDGIFIKHWSRDSNEATKEFCRRHSCDEVLLRVDTLDKRWSKRRGGYIIPVSKARTVLGELNKEGKIAAFLEPVSPYRDLYSLAAVTNDAQTKMTVEIVGPGFDASDLLRGDTLPHERFEVFVPQLSRTAEKQGAVFAQRTSVMHSDDYQRTVKERLVKIGARLKDPAHPEVILNSPGVQGARLAQEAIDFLKRTKQTTLLNHLQDYEPVPRRFLERFVRGVGSIIRGLRRYNIQLGCTAFSGTFTTHGRFVFWDFFPADLTKAKMLYRSS
jgi:hypothetical protein